MCLQSPRTKHKRCVWECVFSVTVLWRLEHWNGGRPSCVFFILISQTKKMTYLKWLWINLCYFCILVPFFVCTKSTLMSEVFSLQRDYRQHDTGHKRFYECVVWTMLLKVNIRTIVVLFSNLFFHLHSLSFFPHLLSGTCRNECAPSWVWRPQAGVQRQRLPDFLLLWVSWNLSSVSFIPRFHSSVHQSWTT